MYPNHLVAAIEATALNSPNSPAIKSSTETLNYGELSRISGHLAGCISQQTSGADPIIVFGHKGFGMITAFIACLKAGHAFVPVDVELPASRVQDICSQLNNPLIIATAPLEPSLAAFAEKGALLDMSSMESPSDFLKAFGSFEAPEEELCVHGEQTQYIIFTSGSTGKPKGIEVSENNVANFAQWVSSFPVVSEGGCTFLDQPPYSFDLSEYEVVGALSTGGCLFCVSHETTNNTREMFSQLSASGVQVWVSTPSFADLCLVDPNFNAELLPSVKLFLFCGEALRKSTAKALIERFPEAIVANTYGPTESTVAVTYCQIGPAELSEPEALPVGRARKGTELKICKPETLETLPAGETGEIVIVGDTVAKGYFNNADKTKQAFFAASLDDGRQVRGYRTGDLGHMDADGMLYCDGRMDSLVKVHGFRIELEDVEENLVAIDGIEQACVVPVLRSGQVSFLKAFVVASKDANAQTSASDAELPSKLERERTVKERLLERVPEYMVPRRIAFIDSMPLTSNGKIDRKSLLASTNKKA